MRSWLPAAIVISCGPGTVELSVPGRVCRRRIGSLDEDTTPLLLGLPFFPPDGQRWDLYVRGRVAFDPDKSGDSRHQAGAFTNGKVYRQLNRAQIVRLSHESAPP